MSKFKKTSKFSELDYHGNWQGLGKEVFKKLSAGKTVECNPQGHLIEGKYVEEVKKKEISNGSD